MSRIRVNSPLEGFLKTGQLASDQGHPDSGYGGKSGQHHRLEKTVYKSSGTEHEHFTQPIDRAHRLCYRATKP